jgi:hypothetical protein
MDTISRNEVQELKEKVEHLEQLITEKINNLEKTIINHFKNLEETKLNKVQESLHRMNNHIDFIHETYSTLQTPLNYFKHKVEYLMGCPSESRALPSIKDKEPNYNNEY